MLSQRSSENYMVHFIVLILGTIMTIMMEVSVQIVIKYPAIKDFAS